MADKFIKLSAQEGGPFSATNNIVNFVIPAGQVYDLRDSFVTFRVSATTSQENALQTRIGDAVYQLGVKLTGSNGHFANASLVRNVSMRCQARGQVENIRRIDQLYDALRTLEVSQRAGKAEAYLGANSLVDANGLRHYGIFTDSELLGATASSYREAFIQVRLGDLMDICNTRMYDGRRLGETQIRMELNIARVEAYVLTENVADSPLNEFEDIPFAAGAENVTQIRVQTNNRRLGAAAGKHAIPSLDQMPFWVGCRIQVTATGRQQNAAAAPADLVVANGNADFRVTRIELSDVAPTRQVILTISPPIALVLDQGYEDLTLVSIGNSADVNVSALSFNTCDITLKQLGAPPPISMPLSMPYATYRTIEDVGPTGVQRFQRMYEIQPECDGIISCFPRSAVDDIFSINQDIDNFRVRCNQVDMTDRDIVVDSPLYYDRTAAGLGAMDLQVNNLEQNTGDCTVVASYEGAYAPAALKKTYLVSKLPQTANAKAVQLNINCGANQVSDISIFQHCPRVIDI